MKSILSLILAIALAPSLFAQTVDYTSAGKNVVTLLSARQFDKAEALFDDRMKAAIPAEKLATVWDQLVEKAGAFQSITGANVSEQGAFHVVVVTCVFANAAIDVQVAFDPQSKVGGLYFRPTAAAPAAWSTPPYADASKFHEQTVSVVDGKWQLPGTVTLPNGKGPFPALVLVHGSGPHDEDETIGPNKPFKDLAYGLASRGIAVLRYAKRTKQYPAESAANREFTVNDEVIDDAVAAVKLLASQPGVDPDHVYVLGHSLGGMLAPRIAQRSAKTAGLVILAGSARPMEDLIVEQVKYLASLNPAAATQEQVAAAERTAAQIRSESLKRTDVVDVLGVKIPAPYFLHLRDYKPAAVAATLKIPMLVLQGGHDYQVTQADYDLWKAALGGRKDVAFRWYPDLTHLFMTAQPGTKPSPADYGNAGHVSEKVVGDIATWIAGGGALK